MKIATINNYNNSKNSKRTPFKSVYTNKFLKNTFKFAEENGALFVATTSFALAGVVRPMVVMLTPKTDKENKKYACVKSIASSLTGLLVVALFSLPTSKAIKKIDCNPEKYLKQETIKNLKTVNCDLKNSKPYIFLTQIFKLGVAMLASIPKSMLTCALIPSFMKILFPKKETKQNQKTNKQKISFKGQFDGSFLTKFISRVINGKKMQNLAKKFQNSNYEMSIISTTDILATGAFVYQNNKKKEIPPKCKKALNYNEIIGTALSILSAFTLDKMLENKTTKFIENFKKANKNLKNVEKYAEGIKIAKKTFILGGIYYAVIPLFATFFADRAEKHSP